MPVAMIEGETFNFLSVIAYNMAANDVAPIERNIRKKRELSCGWVVQERRAGLTAIFSNPAMPNIAESIFELKE